MPGRGGAGNIEAANQAASQVLPTSRSPAQDDQVGNSSLAHRQQQQQQEYAHSGRGGAGNYYSPKQLSQEGAFSSSDKAGPPTAVEAPMTGRGGAGNFRVDEQTLNGRDAGADDPDLRAAIDRDLEKAMPQAPTPAHLRARPDQYRAEHLSGEVEALDAAAR